MKSLGEKKLHHTNRYSHIVLALVLLGGVFGHASAASAQAATLHDAAAQLTKKLSDDPDVQKITGEHIVIAPFENINGKGDAVPRILQEMFTTDFIKTKHFKVLERDQLQSALDELHFQLSDLADPAKAKKIGKLAGAAYVLLGSISDTGSSTSINARIVSIESGESVAAEDEDIKTSDAPLAASGLNPALTTSTSPATAPTDNTPAIDLNANATPTTAGQFTGKKDNFGLLGGTGFKIAWREDLGKDPVYAFSAGDVLGDGTTRFVEYMARINKGTVDQGTIFLSVAKWESGMFSRTWESNGLPDFSVSAHINGTPMEDDKRYSVHLCISPIMKRPAQIIISSNGSFCGDWRWDGTSYSPIPFSVRSTDPVLQWFSGMKILSCDDNRRLFVASIGDSGDIIHTEDPDTYPFDARPTLDAFGGATMGDFDGDGSTEVASAASSDIKTDGSPIEVWGKMGRKAVTTKRYGARLTTWNPSGAKCPFIVARKNKANEQGELNGGFIYFIQWNGESYDEVWHSNKIDDLVIDMQVCDPKSEGKAGLVILSRQDKNYFLTKIVLAK